ncbi:MAG: hypothetical protein E7A86_02850 [Bradyrhizobium sp.]|nr:hypothetical protein [Bradyrhizobium sp.]
MSTLLYGNRQTRDQRDDLIKVLIVRVLNEQGKPPNALVITEDSNTLRRGC